VKDFDQKYKEKIDVAMRELHDKGIIKKSKLSFLSWLLIVLLISSLLVVFFLGNSVREEVSKVFLIIWIGLLIAVIVSVVRDEEREKAMRQEIINRVQAIYEIGMSSDNSTEAAYCYEKRFSLDWTAMWKWIKKEYLSKNK